MGNQLWILLVIGWSWVLALRQRSLGELSLVDIMWDQRSLVVQYPELSSPAQRLRPCPRLEHQDSVIPTARDAARPMRKRRYMLQT